MQNQSNSIQKFLPSDKQIRNVAYDEWAKMYAQRRRSIRLKGYNYSSPGEYFITICTYDYKHIFGFVKNGEMIVNEYGKIVTEEWLETSQLRGNIKLDEFIVMPNHLHGIIIIKNQIFENFLNSNKNGCNKTIEQFGKPCIGSIPTIVRAFKAATTKRINDKLGGCLCDEKRFWHRNYYEHIIRNEYDAYFVREYIKNNPRAWAEKYAPI